MHICRIDYITDSIFVLIFGNFFRYTIMTIIMLLISFVLTLILLLVFNNKTIFVIIDMHSIIIKQFNNLFINFPYLALICIMYIFLLLIRMLFELLRMLGSLLEDNQQLH